MDVLAFHEAIDGYCSDTGQTLLLRLAVQDPQPEQLFVRIEPDNEEYLVAMSAKERVGLWCFYDAEVTKSPHTHQTEYLFKFVSEDDSCWLGSAGTEPHMPRNIHMFRVSHDAHIPAWPSEQIFYQIFPERFANGDPSLSPVSGEYRYLDRVDIVAKQWHEQPDHKTGGFEFFGGDLIGLRERLPYLREQLGVTALYINPVFTSQSSHKYDTIDYFNVDPHFGGNSALQQLIETAHSNQMKVVLDAVINHTSIMHPWFQAALSGSEQDKARYVFNEHGYASWKGHKNLPTLDFSHPVVLNDMITGDDSVIRHWLRPPYNIDGWRMDVVHMIGEGAGAKNNDHYLRELRQVIKSENAEALLLGEHFFEATAWLQGDQEDCAMNYFGFAHPVRAFFAGLDIALHPIKLDAQQFGKWLREARARISFKHQLLQFNQLDSHDTPRFLSMLKGNVELLNVAIGFLMTYIGTPCLYYGTEIGLTGENDPGCRGTFPWDKTEWNLGLFEHTQRWIKHRTTLTSLASGAVVDLYAESDCLVFARVLESEQTLIVLNRGEGCSVECRDRLMPLTSDWEPLEGSARLSQLAGTLTFEVPPCSISLWVRR
jgi:alpha-glucosidase